MKTQTMRVGEIMRAFDLETTGDAWELIIDRGWECVQPLPDTLWQISVPVDEIPKARTR